MSVANVPKSYDEYTVSTHIAQQTRERNIGRGIVEAVLEEGEVKPQKGGEYLLEYDDPLTVDTFCVPVVNDGGEWVMKTAFRKNSQNF
jgi:hypothetical protein